MKQYLAKISTPIWLSVVSIICVSTLLFLYYQATPYYSDDLNFGIRWKDYILGYTDHFDWSEYLSWLKWQLTDDSFRAFNILIPLFLYFPKVVFNLLTAIIFALIVVLTCRVAGINLNRPLRVNLVMAAILLCLPWEDGMTSIAHTINYLWELPPLLLSIIFLANPDKHSRLLLATTGFITGWGHELIGCAMIGGYAVWWFINRKRFNPRTLQIFIPLAAATLFLIINSYFGRYTKHPIFNITWIDWSDLLQTSLVFITNFPLVSIALLFILATAVCSRTRKVLVLSLTSSKRLPLILTAMLISTIEGWLLSEIGTRAYWFSQFFALLAIALLAQQFFPNSVFKRHTLGYAISAVALTLISSNLISGTIATRELSSEAKTIVDNYLMNEAKNNRFFPMESFKDLPVLAFNRLPLADTQELSIFWASYRYFYGNGDEPYPIPYQLRHIDPAKLVKIPGDNPFSFYDGWIVENADNPDNSPRQYVITYSWGVRRNANYEYNQFTDDTGHQWNFVMNPYNDAQSRWARIKRIDRK